MRRRWTLIPILLVCLLPGTIVSAQNTKTLRVQPRTGTYAGQTFYTNSHALLIGVRTYANLPKSKWLDYADADAKDLRDVLVRSYGFLSDNVTILLNEQATKANIEAALASLADDNRVKKDDRILVFFSGHGQTVKLKSGGDMGFLIPYDANVDLAHPENSGPYLASCLPMDHVWSYLQGSPAKHSLLVADACYGGLLAKSRTLNGEKPNAAVIATLLARPAMQVLTAGSRDEEAFEDPKLGHGAFSFKLIEELRAQAALPDTVFTASELAGALKTSVGNVTNGKQTPQFGNYADTEGDFVFATTPDREVPPLPWLGLQPETASSRPIPLPGGAGGQPHRYSGATRPESPQRGDVWIYPKDGAELVFIPAGSFQMGDDDDTIKDNGTNARNNPRHTVTLSGYWIYKNVVTVKQYKQFCQATGRKMPPEPGGIKVGDVDMPKFNPGWSYEGHPIVNVSWEDAKAYCDWAGVRLPTEAEWEKAARGTEGREYPWGGDFDRSKLWCSKSKAADAGGTAAVGKYGVGPYGVTDMAGNVWQWCADWYDSGYCKTDHGANPTGPTSGLERVLRGGSWPYYDQDAFRSATRFSFVPGDRGQDDFGFRGACGL